MIEFEIDFRDQKALDRVAREGWGPAEAFGAWMLGARSVLVLPPPPRRDARFVLRAVIGPMLIPGVATSQRFRILINGALVTAAHVRQLHHVNCPVPAEALGEGGPLEIVIEHPDALRQSDYGMGEDVRQIAGSIWSLTLLGECDPPWESAPNFDRPVFQTRPRGDLGNRMIQHMVALSVADLAPNVRLIGAELPEWGLPATEDEGVWANWAEADDQALEVAAVAEMLNSGRARRVVHRGYGQRIGQFLPREAYREVFRADLPEIQGYDERHLVIDIGVGDGHGMSLPVEFYRQIVADSFLLPVFMGRTDPSPYTDALRQAFPDATFLPSLGALDDFELLRRSAHIVVAISPLSWLAAWLSEARQIVLPVNGLFDPRQTPGVDLLPTDDPRYRFFLFPVNHASADFAAAHAAIDWQWREASGLALAELRRSIPFPATPELDAAPLIEWRDDDPPPSPRLPASAVPEDGRKCVDAAEAAARSGHALDALHHLRFLPLIDFARLLWSMPRADYPGLSDVLPRMPATDVQQGCTGRADDELATHSADLCRIVAQQFHAIAGRSLRHGRVLDFGCGWGRMLPVFWHLTDPQLCAGLDTSPDALALCRSRNLPGDFALCRPGEASLPPDWRRFDLILAYSVFTHTPPEIARRALAALRRCIRPNGVLALSLRPAEFWLASGGADAPHLLESHRAGGMAYRSLGIVSDAGEELYGDMSMSLDALAAIAPDWEIEAMDRGLDPLETLVFLTPR
jgi:SAM-dependent methyltransferase